MFSAWNSISIVVGLLTCGAASDSAQRSTLSPADSLPATPSVQTDASTPSTPDAATPPISDTTGTPTKPDSTSDAPKWPNTKRLLDFPPVLTLRRELADKGIELRVRFVQNAAVTISGGDTEGAANYAHRLNLDILLDTAKLGLWEGGRVKVELDHDQGEESNVNTGASSAFRLIRMNNDRTRLRDAYYEHKLTFDPLYLRGIVGQFSSRREFARSTYTSDWRYQYSNSALIDPPGIPQRIGLGILLEAGVDGLLGLEDKLYLRTAVMDGESSSATYSSVATSFDSRAIATWFGEVGTEFELPGPNGNLPGSVRTGLYFDGNEYQVLDYNRLGNRLPPTFEAGINGVYVTADQLVWKENAEENDAQGLSLHAKYHTQTRSESAFPEYYQGGAQYEGLIPTRDKDVLGVALGLARRQNAAPNTLVDEIVVEWYYQIEIFPWWKLTPSIQHIISPGGSATRDPATVIGLKSYMVW